jgi:hypothetical protein
MRESMRLFKRDNSIVIGFICTLYDESGRCLSQGRGISFIGFQGESLSNELFYMLVMPH